MDCSQCHHVLQEDCLGFDHRLYCKVLLDDEKEKQERFCNHEDQPEGEEERVAPGDLCGVGGEEIPPDSQDSQEEIMTDTSKDQCDEECGGSDEEGSEYSYYSDSGECSEEPEVEKEDVEERVGPSDPPAKLPVDRSDILADLTPCDVRVLLHSEEELTQCQTYDRIFPTQETDHYLQVFLLPPSRF